MRTPAFTVAVFWMPSVFFCLFSFQPGFSQQTWELKSPDRKISVSVTTGPSLTYSVIFKGQAIIVESPLGITIDGQAYGKDFRFVKKKNTTINKKYTLT